MHIFKTQGKSTWRSGTAGPSEDDSVSLKKTGCMRDNLAERSTWMRAAGSRAGPGLPQGKKKAHKDARKAVRSLAPQGPQVPPLLHPFPEDPASRPGRPRRRAKGEKLMQKAAGKPMGSLQFRLHENELRPEDLAKVLLPGASIPSQFLPRGSIIQGIPDRLWRSMTLCFPRTLKNSRKCHPCYVLDRNEYGIIICPCSTKVFHRNRIMIPEGLSLDYTGKVMSRTSFLVENAVVFLPFEWKLPVKTSFSGVCPAESLIDLSTAA